MARQLALPFAHQAEYAPEDFLPAASNEAARIWLARTPDWPFGRLALCGPAGCGKTHLLHVWCGRENALRLSGPELRGLPEFSAGGGIALDDADLADEIFLLHLINAAAEAGRALLLAGREAPARWAVRLADLASRLRATTPAQILPAEESLLRALLARLLAERQLAVPEAVQDWLLLRLPRSQGAIREAAARLDRAALATGGGVTRALAATVLASFPAEDGDEGTAKILSPVVFLSEPILL
jgi:chromosomal replication initiation ATPase DnaA